MEDISVIIRIIKDNKEIYDIVEKLKFEDFNYFTKEELSNKYSEDELSKLKLFFSGESINKDDIIKYNLICKKDDILKIEKEFLGLYFSSRIKNLLNTLEYFAMYFNHNVADDETVYQSLHISYLYIVKYLYFNISNSNFENKEAEKIFTNIILLYKNWRDRHIKKERKLKEIENKRKIKKEKETSPKSKI